MKLNDLSANYDTGRLGPQKRRTEFESLEQKLFYDARELVGISLKQSDKLKTPVNPMLFARRIDDNNEELEPVVNITLIAAIKIIAEQ